MAVTQTTRLGLYRWSAGSDPFTRAHMTDSHDALEDLAVIFESGLGSARPSAGTEGHFYWATDDLILSYDDGVNWHDLAPVDSPVFTGDVTLPADTALDNPLVRMGKQSLLGSSLTLSLTDEGNFIEFGNGSSTCTLNVPTDATADFPDGAQVTVMQTGTGQMTIAAVTPGTTTVVGTPGLKLRAQYSVATLIKRGTNSWVVTGDLTA